MNIINKEKIRFENPNQIINMGGPWIGELFYGEFKIATKVIIDNLVMNEESGKLFFVEYHDISKWQKNNSFTINSLDGFGNLCKYDTQFKTIYIDNIDIQNNLHYFEAFHEKGPEKKRMKKMDEINRQCYRIEGFKV